MIKLTTIKGIRFSLAVGESFRVVAGNTRVIFCPDAESPTKLWSLSTKATADCGDDVTGWPTATTEELQACTTVESLVEFVRKRCAKAAA